MGVNIFRKRSGKWCIYIAPLTKALHRDCALHSPIYTHIHTPVAEETMQVTNLLIRRNWGFRVLLKDSSTLTLGEPGIELGTFRVPSAF